MNANSGEVRRRAEFEGTRRTHHGAAGWYAGEYEPAPVRATPREELLRLALACEEGWNKLKERDATKFRTAANGR
jgi:hypothetical protein